MLWAGCLSFVLCVLLVCTKDWHGKLSMDFTHGVQKFHTAPTPRVGGLPVVLGFSGACFLAQGELKPMLTNILLAGLPAFVFGLAEDLTKRVSVLQRLLATMASGVLAWWLTGYSITHVGVVGVDGLLGLTLVSVLFTAFAVGGVANAINIIDGFNGLASTASTLAFLGYGAIAYLAGDTTLAWASSILAACVFGFFLVNWPFGKIFLGDGGSYFIGFALAWVAVELIERNPTVSPFAALLVCAHPVTEVLFSIYRRKIRKEHPGMPDRLHFHSLVKRRYVLRWFSNFSLTNCNSITGLLVGWMNLVPIVLAALTYTSNGWSAVAFVAMGLLYVAIYARMVRHHWCSPLQFLLYRPASRVEV